MSAASRPASSGRAASFSLIWAASISISSAGTSLVLSLDEAFVLRRAHPKSADLCGVDSEACQLIADLLGVMIGDGEELPRLTKINTLPRQSERLSYATPGSARDSMRRRVERGCDGRR